MKTEVLENVLDLIFTDLFPWVSPLIFLLIVIQFADRLVLLLADIISSKRRRY